VSPVGCHKKVPATAQVGPVPGFAGDLLHRSPKSYESIPWLVVACLLSQNQAAY